MRERKREREWVSVLAMTVFLPTFLSISRGKYLPGPIESYKSNKQSFQSSKMFEHLSLRMETPGTSHKWIFPLGNEYPLQGQACILLKIQWGNFDKKVVCFSSLFSYLETHFALRSHGIYFFFLLEFPVGERFYTKQKTIWKVGN